MFIGKLYDRTSKHPNSAHGEVALRDELRTSETVWKERQLRKGLDRLSESIAEGRSKGEREGRGREREWSAKKNENADSILNE
jgi:hypothetical protein